MALRTTSNIRYLEAEPVDQGVVSAPSGLFSAAFDPTAFKDYMYAGGANDALATQRGVQYARQQGWNPEQTVLGWNQALGTNFSVDDYYRLTGLTPQEAAANQNKPLFSNFGAQGGWDFGQGAEYDPQTNLIKAPGTVFQSGQDAIVSDELFWNPHSVTGADLQKRITDTQAQGQRAGVVITPYAVFQGKATNEQFLDEIKNSGTDFVTIDPYYLGFGASSKELYDWAKDFVPKVNALGKEVKLVTQGFAPKGKEQEVLEHNQKMLALPGVNEFINFGLEDAKDLQGDPNWVSISNDYSEATAPVRAPTPTEAQVAAPVNADSFSEAAQRLLDRPETAALGRGRDTRLSLGDDLQTYEKIGETGDDWSGRQVTYQVYDAYGNPAGTTTVNASQGIQGALEAAVPLIAMGLTAGGAGGALGGFLSGGALTGTAASALGNALIAGGSGALTGQDPLKAALLAAGGTYAGGLFGGGESAATQTPTTSTLTDAQFIAADAAQLAGQGLGIDQIEQVLRASGVSTSIAAVAADAATSGLSADQIAKDITLGNRSLFTDTAATAPATPTTVSTDAGGLQTVATTGTAPVVNAGASAGGLLGSGLGLDWFADQSMTKTGTPLQESSPMFNPVNTPDMATTQLPPGDQQVTVVGDRPAVTLDDILAAVVSNAGTNVSPDATVSPAPKTVPETLVTPPNQVIDTVGTKAPPSTLEDAIAALVNPVVNAPSVAPSTPADQAIEVPGTKATQDYQDSLGAALSSLVNPVVNAPSVAPSTTGNQVIEVPGTKAANTTNENLAAAIAATVNPETVVAPPNEVIEVPGTKATPSTTDPLGDAIATVVNPPVVPNAPVVTPPNEVIEVPGTKATPSTTNDNLAAAIAATVNPLAVTTGSTPPANQVVEVPGTKAGPSNTIGNVAAAINAGTQYGPGMTGTQTTVYDKVLETTGSKPAADVAATAAGALTLTDILKALTGLSSAGLLGGGGGGGGGGQMFTAPTTPVPVGNADYYKAIQQYYNTYMPAAPRDVATPLQQWYEGKFGG
jgi:hypothetical protein